MLQVSWGIDLASEHERFLTEEIFKKPTIVYNYPKDIKAFYMRLNDDGKTVAAMDVLVPGVGELIGGSQREERLEVSQREPLLCGLIYMHAQHSPDRMLVGRLRVRVCRQTPSELCFPCLGSGKADPLRCACGGPALSSMHWEGRFCTYAPYPAVRDESCVG